MEQNSVRLAPISASKRHRKVEAALRLIRKAHTRDSMAKLERLKHFAVPENRDIAISDKIKIPYSESQPISISDLSIIMHQAKEAQTIAKEIKKSESKNMKIGKPRDIFPAIVSKIREEEAQAEALRRREEHEKRKLARARIEEAKLSRQSSGTLTRPNSAAPVAQSSSLITPARVRGLSVSIDSDQGSDSGNSAKDRMVKSPNFIRQASRNRSQMSLIRSPMESNRPKSAGFHINSFDSGHLIEPRRRATSRIFEPSVLDRDEKIRAVLEARDLLLQSRQEDIHLKMTLRERQREEMQALEDFSVRRLRTLQFVCTLSKVGVLINLISEFREWKRTSLSEYNERKAARLLSRIWWYKRLDLRIKRNPELMSKLRVWIRCMWRKLRVYRVKQGIAMVKTFIMDSTGISEYMRKIYDFRAKVIRIQRYMRSWIACVEGRTELMWLAYEKIYKRKLHEFRLKSNESERKSLENTALLPGFGNSMAAMQFRKTTLSKLYAKGAQAVKNYSAVEKRLLKESEDMRFEMGPLFPFPAAARRRKEKNLSMSVRSNEDNSAFFLNTGSRASTSGRRGILIGKSRSYWYRKMMAGSATREKLLMMRHLVGLQRKRHVYSVSMEEQTFKSRLKDMKVNIAGLRTFLKDPNSLEGIDDAVVVDDNVPFSKRRFKKGKLSPLFLMLTQGGLGSIDNVIQFSE